MSAPNFSVIEDEIVAILKATVLEFNDQVFAATDIRTDSARLVAQPPSCLVQFNGLSAPSERNPIGRPLARRFTAVFSTIIIARTLRATDETRPMSGLHPIAVSVIETLFGARIDGTARPMDLSSYKPIGEDAAMGLVSWELVWDTMVTVTEEA